MTADQVYDKVLEYTSKYDEQFHDLLAADPDYAKAIFAIGRGGKKPRKDITVWANVKPYIGFFYDPYFEIKDSSRIAINPDDYKLDKSLKGEFIRAVSADNTLDENMKEKIIACGIGALMGEDLFEA